MLPIVKFLPRDDSSLPLGGPGTKVVNPLSEYSTGPLTNELKQNGILTPCGSVSFMPDCLVRSLIMYILCIPVLSLAVRFTSGSLDASLFIYIPHSRSSGFWRSSAFSSSDSSISDNFLFTAALTGSLASPDAASASSASFKLSDASSFASSDAFRSLETRSYTSLASFTCWL